MKFYFAIVAFSRINRATAKIFKAAASPIQYPSSGSCHSSGSHNSEFPESLASDSKGRVPRARTRVSLGLGIEPMALNRLGLGLGLVITF